MSAVLIVTIFLLSAVSFAIYRTKRRSLKGASDQEFVPAPRGGLFGDPQGARRGEALPEAPPENVSAERAAELRERASRGDLSALDEAREAPDADLYGLVMKTLLERDRSVENVTSVSAHVVANRSLRGDERLARTFMAAWQESPSEVRLGDLLRVAALSDDARVFQDVVEAVVEAWEAGRLPRRTPGDLAQLFESEYWVLSAGARRSGAGFLLKQRLADVRRHLAARSRRPTLSTGQGQG